MIPSPYLRNCSSIGVKHVRIVTRDRKFSRQFATFRIARSALIQATCDGIAGPQLALPEQRTACTRGGRRGRVWAACDRPARCAHRRLRAPPVLPPCRARTLLTLAAGFYAATHLTVDTDIEQHAAERPRPGGRTRFALDQRLPAERQPAGRSSSTAPRPNSPSDGRAPADRAAAAASRSCSATSASRMAAPFFERNGAPVPACRTN